MSGAALRAEGGGRYALVGPLTFDSAPGLWQEGLDLLGRGSDVVFDLGGVSRSDSAGLALLVEWMREAGRRGTEVRFRNIPEQLLAIARISRLQELLPREAE